MIEAYAIKKITELLLTYPDCDFTQLVYNLDTSEAFKMFKNQDEAALSNKMCIDALAIKFGITDTLKRIIIEKDKISNAEYESKNLMCNAQTVKLALCCLYDRVEEYYQENVYIKIIKHISKLDNATFDVDEFLSDIRKDSLPLDMILLPVGSEFFVQESLWETAEMPREIDIAKENYAGAVLKKYNIKTSSYALLYNYAGKRKLKTYLDAIMGILNEHEKDSIDIQIFRLAYIKVYRHMISAPVKPCRGRNEKTNYLQYKMKI